MSSDYIFSWAENAEGRMVHVDSVPRGLQCNCVCPRCHERLEARHGEVRGHGFAHCGQDRRANLDICYMVVLYKLAEQIIKENKRIHAPSYYGIFRDVDIEFVDVKIDACYEREDKQPDVIATTLDGNQYLIEFSFDYKVQRKKAIDYTNLNCLEINLSGQTLDTLKKFLLEEKSNRIWLNNQCYFDSIEERYKKNNKIIELKAEKECEICVLRFSCLGVRSKNTLSSFLTIENNGKRYRICKTNEYNEKIALYHQSKKESEEKNKVVFEHYEDILLESDSNDFDSYEKNCFMCATNIKWKNQSNPGYANCGSYSRLKISERTPPDTAITCPNFTCE